MTTILHTGIDWTLIDAVIFDVDGTLFDHIRLRRHMIVRLFKHVLTYRFGWRDVRALSLYRRTRERLAVAEADNIGERQFLEVAQKTGLSADEVKALVARWIYREPLAFVARYAAPDAGLFIAKLHQHGIRTGVFSDYPADDKLAALRIATDIVRDASLPEIDRFKPQPDGFLRVAELLEVPPNRCLIIGDRDDRDGEAARRGGFIFLRKTATDQHQEPFAFSRYRQLVRELECLGVQDFGGRDKRLKEVLAVRQDQPERNH